MNSEKKISSTKVCPTCGTRLSENATRCPVCGRTFTHKPPGTSTKRIQPQRLPEVSLSLPSALGLILLTLAIGAGIIFLFLRNSGKMATISPTATMSPSPTFMQSSTPTITPTLLPTLTPEPPVEYSIKEGDTCSLIAFNFQVSVRSIAELNNLPPDCGVLSLGQTILVPRPTPTPSPMPTGTLSVAEATEEACPKIEYRVGENDTLSGIAANYAVSIETLKSYNGLTSNSIYSGQIITIPLCERLPTQGPTPTPTLPPPYPPTNLLLPADGAIFTGANDTITLQWSAIGGMLEGESYAITLEDLTEGEGKKRVDYSTDTKYIIPTSFRPAEITPHIIRWWIQPVRQSGTTDEGDQIWVPAGAASIPRVFAWSGIGETTPAP